MYSHYSILPNLLKKDFDVREELVKSGALFDGYNPRMEEIHVSNAMQLEGLLDKYGWPDPETEETELCESAWYIVMHAISLPSFQKRILQIFKENPSLREPNRIAMLEDRVRVFSGRKQLYGTQFDWDIHGELNPYPLEYPETVDELRRMVHLPRLEKSLISLKKRAALDNEHPPSDPKAYIDRRIQWMLKTGWIQSLADIDSAYYVCRK